MKRVTITFDFEGAWGMPHDASYDLMATTKQILATLEKNQARAVFFVSGKLIEENSDVIKLLHAGGHEIGLHGYTHEHMHQLTDATRTKLMKRLRSVSDRLEQLVGVRPVGFRAPYLMGPTFYVPETYAALKELGMTWISNREIRLPEELFRPDRLPFGRSLLKFRALRQLMLIALNPNVIFGDPFDGKNSKFDRLRWLIGAQAPFVRPEGLTEYPLTSPLDCDMLAFPKPHETSGSRMTDFAKDVTLYSYAHSGEYFNVNVHDWLTGSQDRLAVLDAVLARVTADGCEYFLPGTGASS